MRRRGLASWVMGEEREERVEPARPGSWKRIKQQKKKFEFPRAENLGVMVYQMSKMC